MKILKYSRVNLFSFSKWAIISFEINRLAFKKEIDFLIVQIVVGYKIRAVFVC